VEFLAERTPAAPEKVLGVEYWLVDSANAADPLHPGNTIGDWFDYLLRSRFGIRNAGAECPALSGCEAWEVVDQNAGIPDALQGLVPETVIGNYAVYRLP
jgi:hypothetical protein